VGAAHSCVGRSAWVGRGVCVRCMSVCVREPTIFISTANANTNIAFVCPRTRVCVWVREIVGYMGVGGRLPIRGRPGLGALPSAAV